MIPNRGQLAPLLFILCILSSCIEAPAPDPADLILMNGNVYSLSWSDPDTSGAPAADAPRTASGWAGDAEAVAMQGGKIVFVGSSQEATKFQGPDTRIIGLKGATAVPGLIESHAHVAELGQTLSRVDLRGLETADAILDAVRNAAETIPSGQWIKGYGWDEGVWADRYPNFELLSREVPDHPVYLRGLHGFAVWGNRLAFERAGINRRTVAPVGGEILKDSRGNPTGILLNRAVELLDEALPAPTVEEVKVHLEAGLKVMAESGYVAIHEAGAGSVAMAALEELEAEDRLPVRVYAMLSERDSDLMDEWLRKGPDQAVDGMLVTRSVKAYYDGALGSRGARLLEEYSDQPGHRGVSGSNYGFDQARVAAMMKAGFQVGIHAIGDAGNRETLGFVQSVLEERTDPKAARHRIEHAQVLHPDDIPRFSDLGILALMQPPHAVEDKKWAETRLGLDRCRFAYAWRSLRRAGVRLAFSSDLPGSDWDIFYGLHSAITRRSPDLQPIGGWFPEEAMTAEEALRGYTVWGAYSSFMENETGTLEPGKWADVTVMDIDPLAVGATNPAGLLEGRILLTVAAGRVVFDNLESAEVQDKPELISSIKIWDEAPHSAFTDLIRFKGGWYCTFREGAGHVYGENGTIRVLSSNDGESWESATLLSEEGIDLRDPKLAVTPDGRLMLLLGGSVYKGKELITRQPRVAFSRDGRNWTEPQPVLSEGDWLWRVTWFEGRAYGVSYTTADEDWLVKLYRSDDGVQYDLVTDLQVPGRPNETTLRFLSNGEMVALVRREGEDNHAWIGTSRAPHTAWAWSDAGHRVGGPNFIVLPDGRMWAAGRGYGKMSTTVLAKLYRERYEPVLTLPSGGDTSYPGLVWHEGLLWISYYSSHEGRTSIYLAKVRL